MPRIGGTLAHLLLGVLLNLASAAGSLAQATSDQVWTLGAPMPTPRSELTAAALRGRVYVAGGIAQFGTTTAFEVYDPALGAWEELPALPEAVHHLAAAATGNRVYVTGGYTDLGFSAMSRHAFAYDPEARTWAAIASAAQTKPKMASRRCWNGPTPIRPSAWSMGTAGIGSSPLTACSVDLALVRVRACCKARSSIWRAIAG